MVRFAFAGLAMLALAGAAAAEEDNGPVLVDLVAKICAVRPALPSEMERIALGLGFVSTNGAISADMERGPRIDIVYFARLMNGGEKVSLSAYFEGRMHANDPRRVGRCFAPFHRKIIECPRPNREGGC